MRIFVGADWMNLEGRLTAYFSKDPVLQQALDNELLGGPKVHALNAALIYGISPEQAKSHIVNMKGQRRPAYDAGKRLTHAWNYGATPRKLSETFWISLPFAKDVDAKLRERYAGVVEWRLRVVDEVFGVSRYRCGQCDYTQLRSSGSCPRCSNGRFPVAMQWDGWEQYGKRELRTPFGRRRLYPGRRKDSANAVISQLPQSCGASMWYRTLRRLHGDGLDVRWPMPAADLLYFDQGTPYIRASDSFGTFLATGTYDSFLIETEEEYADSVESWLRWTMEQPWPQLAGLRIPAEASRGMNWGKSNALCRNCGHEWHRICGVEGCMCHEYVAVNYEGLTDVANKPFQWASWAA